MGALKPVEELGQLAQPLAGQHQVDQLVVIGEHVLGLGDGLAEQPARPQREPAALLPLAVTAARTSATTNCECPVSASTARTTSATSSGSDVGDLQVEVGGERVADVGLDQRLEPGARRGQPVVVLQRRRRSGSSRRTTSTPRLSSASRSNS